MRAFIFPGQGSQSVGMGKALAEAFAAAREVFEEVDDALNQRLSKVMWEGPESELALTENTQPAVMTASLAALRVLEKGGALQLSKHARLVAGHSAGEYGAACAFTLSDTARLLRTRGRAMQEASPVGEGAMSALLGIEMNLVEEACKEASDVGVVVVANDNAPGQIVISGAAKAVERANEIAKKKGAKRAIPLNVSTPNHSPLLQSAADKMREALARITIRPTVVPLISNVTASEIGDPDRIRSLLVEQLTARVRWRESVAGFRALGAAMTVEMGGNKVLTGMVKRIDRELEPVTLDSPADIEAFAKTL